jgi:site-specific DNA-methyltransferase (adenine-specific)
MIEPYYQDDSCTIYHGDCREILPGLGPVDLVLTDPPYAISVSGSEIRSQTPSGGPNGRRRLDFFSGDSDWLEMRKLVVGGIELAATLAPSIYVWCGHRSFGDIVDLLEDYGFSTRFLVWKKLSAAPAPPGSGWASAAELCVYGYRSGRTWNPAHRPNVLEAQTMRPGQPNKTGHPTQKPRGVIDPLIEASSSVTQTILDPFMGSGTTLRAAKDLGRKAIGIEIEERYCEIAAKRLSQEVLL